MASQIASPSQSRTLAVVDRTANLRLAAKELVAARFAFGGSSPYAPGLVFVNEFVKEDFLQAVIEEAENAAPFKPDAKTKPSQTSAAKDLEALLKDDPDAQLILQKSTASIVELRSRSPESLPPKPESRILKVIATTSLDDAIDLINGSCSSAASSPALAAYHFSNAATGKYLSQFIDARATFVSHVPRDLLVGPAFPTTGRAFELSAPYTPADFSVARPGFVKPSATSVKIAAVLDARDGSKAQALLRRAMEPLKVMKRKAGGGVGEFYHSLTCHVHAGIAFCC